MFGLERNVDVNLGEANDRIFDLYHAESKLLKHFGFGTTFRDYFSDTQLDLNSFDPKGVNMISFLFLENYFFFFKKL